MTYDLTSLEFLQNPADMLATMRADAPLVRAKVPFLGQVWFTTTDAAARVVLKDPSRFVRDPKPVTGKSLAQRFWFFPRFMQPLFANMLGKDGDAHKRLRGLVDQAFARTNIETLRPELSQIANDLIDQIDPTQPTDIIRHYARPLPLAAICVLLGIPEQDRARVGAMISPLSGPTTKWAIFKAFPGLYRAMRHFRADFETVRKAPRPGVISDLVHTNNAGDTLTEDELLAMVVTLFIAGHETTVHLITMTLLTLTTRPEARKALRDDPDTLPLLIEEVMRLISPVMMTKPHFVTQDTDIDGVPLKKGDQIAAFLIAANHDPARFDTPEAFIPNRRPNAHIGFGHGPHVCLGMQLARAEAQVAITELFKRFPDLALSNENDPPQYLQRIGIHGLKELKLTLRQ
jgi:cytochrome P450